jgi:hypothetical protein
MNVKPEKNSVALKNQPRRSNASNSRVNLVYGSKRKNYLKMSGQKILFKRQNKQFGLNSSFPFLDN